MKLEVTNRKVTTLVVGKWYQNRVGDIVKVLDMYSDSHNAPYNFASCSETYTESGFVWVNEESDGDLLYEVDVIGDSPVETKPTTTNISLDKKYTTRDGNEVKLLYIIPEEYRSNSHPVKGLVKVDDAWTEWCWTLDGRLHIYSSEPDLVEVTPFAEFKIDDPVMVRDCGDHVWQRGHFAGVDLDDGSPLTWSNGKTSWTTALRTVWIYCRKPTPEELAS